MLRHANWSLSRYAPCRQNRLLLPYSRGQHFQLILVNAGSDRAINNKCNHSKTSDTAVRCLSSASPSPSSDSSSSSSPSSRDPSSFRIPSSWTAALPKTERLQSATGRARKRRRKAALKKQQEEKQLQQLGFEAKKEQPEEPEKVYSYPKGKPWKVLWPDPYADDPNSIRPKYRKIPRLQDIRNGLSMYMETWEDGIQGVPKPGSQRGEGNFDEDDDDFTIIKKVKGGKSNKKTAVKRDKNANKPKMSKKGVEDNLKKNIGVARDGAQAILKHASKTTGINDTKDLRKIAEELLQLATACLKEFMAGYRQGRDNEVDKMLNEYFKEQSAEEDSNKDGGKDEEKKNKRKRKPKRATLLRD